MNSTLLLHELKKAIKNKNFIILVTFFYILFSLNHILNGGVFYDDWSLTVGYLADLSFIDKFYDLVFKTFLTRPVGGLYLTLLTEIGKVDEIYISINSTLWLISSLIIYITIKNKLKPLSSKIYLLIVLFPSFASTMIFSPVTQSLGVLSIFFWSISIYFANLKKIKLSILFFIISVLTYEVSIVLFFFNILILSLNKNENEIYKRIKNLFLLYLTVIFGIFLFQIFISKFLNNTTTLKYAFWFENGKIFFEDNFFENIKIYFFKPLTLLIADIPLLLIKSIYHIKFNFLNIVYLFLFITLIIFANKKSNLFKSLNINNFKNYFIIIIILSSISVFFVYLVVSSVPQVNGYYNRGLVGLFICFAFFMSILNEYDLKIKLFNKLKLFLIFIIIALNFNSFLVQQNNHLLAEIKRNILLNKISTFFKDKKKSTLFVITPTFLEKNYNDEVIFSEEVMDLFFAVRFTTKSHVVGNRVYIDENCNKILNISENKITGFVPSKNRKIKDKENTIFNEGMSAYSIKEDMYLYYKKKFTKLTYNNNENNIILNKLFKCKITY